MLIFTLPTGVGVDSSCICIHHGGSWYPSMENVYVGGSITTFLVGIGIKEKQIMKYVAQLGHRNISKVYFLFPGQNMQKGLTVLYDKSSIFELWCALIGTSEVHLYIEHGDKDNDSSSIASWIH